MTVHLPSVFERHVDDTTYTVGAQPVLLYAAGAAVIVALFVVLLVVARRTKGALVTPFVPVLAAPMAGGAVFLALVPWHKHPTSEYARDVFRDVLMLDGIATAVAAGVVAATILVLAIRSEGHLKLVPWAIPILLAGLFVSRGSLLHARSIKELGALPFYVVEGLPEMHVGRSYDVPVALSAKARRWWFFGWHEPSGPSPLDEESGRSWHAQTSVRVEAKAAGDQRFVARAERGPVKMETRLHVRARREAASPFLSLRVGDTFVYRVHARGSSGAVLYFITIGPSSHVDEVRIRVLEARERAGFRTFVLAVEREDEHREVEVVAVDGETREFDPEHRRIGEEVVASRADESAPDPVSCSFRLLGAPIAKCQRGGREADVAAPPLSASESKVKLPRRRTATTEATIARPPVAFAGAAPAYFERHTSDTGSSIVTAFVAVITIGLVIPPDGSKHASYTLVSTQRGPEGAPEALP
ncbi:MAG: hypothetical protein JST00_33060 [Deltaproteobacteria bacterium]|nr:hypothetical protein [Deltaproteobacteria bacterium]